MTRKTDPFVLGWGSPELRVPADVVALLAPAIEAWVAEHRKMGATTKLYAAEPIVERWRSIAYHYRNGTLPGYSGESSSGSEVAAGRTSPHDYVSAATAADRLGCSPQWVAQLVKRGELDGHQPSREWVVCAWSVEEYLRRRDAA